MRTTTVARAIALLLASCPAFAAAAGTFVPAANRVDMAHDAERGLIYITDGTQILRYAPDSASFLTPIAVGGQLGGLDLSPDGDTLAVADRSSTASEVRVHLVDPDDLSIQTISTAKAFSETGTYTVAFAGDGTLLATGRYGGSGWVPLRRLDPAAGTWTTLGEVRQDTMLAASDAGNAIAFAEANISDGRWGRYDVLSGELVRREWYENGTGWFNFEIATNATGDQFAIPTYDGTYVYDAAYAHITTLGAYAGPQPIGVAYAPVEAKAYFPWAQTREVRVFDMNSFTQVGTYDFEDNFVHTGNRAFGQGRTKVSRDGSLLMVSVTGGVRFLRMYAPLAAAAVNASTADDTAVTLSLPGSIGNDGALSYSIVTTPAHGSVSLSGNQATYTPVAGYVGADGFRYRVTYGRAVAEAEVSLTVTQSNVPPTASNDVAYARNKPVSIAVLANDSDPNGDPLRLTAITAPGRGSAVIQGNVVVYTPPKGFNGSTSFNYTVSDGRGGVASAQVTVIRN